MDNFDNIKTIVDDVLGDPKRDYCGSGGWYEYNCPHCAEEGSGRPDGKYNFAVQISEDGLWGHCWRCGYHGKLSKIIKKYGSTTDIDNYREELHLLKENKLYTLSGSISGYIDDINDNDSLSLPDEFRLLKERNTYNAWAYNYLEQRGVKQDIIDRFGIGYVGGQCGRYSNRIIIPSYDAYGELNYWVARDYTGRSMTKILNPNIDKMKIVFNESLVNWYEPITLVEGPFDHIVVPNSIPLLGKSLGEDYEVFKQLITRSHSRINILLDDDATNDAYRLYKFLNVHFKDNVRVIECPDGYDASDYYKDYGTYGIVSLLRSAHKLDDYTIANI